MMTASHNIESHPLQPLRRIEVVAANHIGSNGKTYITPWSWKFNSLQYEYRQTHPFES